MNILPIFPQIQNNFTAKRQTLNNRTVIQPKIVQSLDRDTVSFTSSAKISDFMTKSVAENLKRMERIATTYLDVLESVASKLKDDGVSFDRVYCELNPVKSPESYVSKIVRSGDLKVPDAIRATLYVKDPYDLSILTEKILPEMQKRGYVIADTKMSITDLIKRGYIPSEHEAKNPTLEKVVPDLDIRLDDVSEQVTKLDPQYRYCIGKPQKSGYEDIQMRFVREQDKKKNPVLHELIILFGPNYSHAKHVESNRVYKHLREFDELHIRPEEAPITDDKLKASRYIELIRKMFRGKISEKLFLNAKNKDLYDISDEVPISFSDTDINILEGYFKGLTDKISAFYRKEKAAAKPSEMATHQLTSDLRQDKSLINKLQTALRSTIDDFNYQNNLKKTAD